ncbi:MAG TPA: hypothetical protein VK149_03495 [Sideroxyarcus sp.]|nr:hypothetical protein [Sideroxyarcus sp.]
MAKEKLASSGAKTKLRVAFHVGPHDITFMGKPWQRDVAQPVTADEWAAMQLRPNFKYFDFSEETQS